MGNQLILLQISKYLVAWFGTMGTVMHWSIKVHMAFISLSLNVRCFQLLKLIKFWYYRHCQHHSARWIIPVTRNRNASLPWKVTPGKQLLNFPFLCPQTSFQIFQPQVRTQWMVIPEKTHRGNLCCLKGEGSKKFFLISTRVHEAVLKKTNKPENRQDMFKSKLVYIYKILVFPSYCYFK